MANEPFQWDVIPSSWAELGMRTLYEIYVVARDGATDDGVATATPGELARALDRAIRGVTSLAQVQDWADTKMKDVPEVAA